MSLYNNIVALKEQVSVIGLGYVGLPIAVSFSKKTNVIGFDINNDRIQMYRNGKDSTCEVGDEAIASCDVHFTSDESDLKRAKFHIIAVPTPVRKDNTPDLSLVISASQLLGRNLQKGSLVVYESTVYPGVTEEICIPVLEKASGLKCGVDFKVGYSPERINPGDKAHRLETIIKIVSGMDTESLEEIASVYQLVIQAGVYKAESIKVAEAAKVIENSQRDINIAFMNELSIIFNKMNIDTQAVLSAAKTKWNFLDFSPGLVGGHCIGVDPYYLTYRAAELGYHSQIILSGRRINDDMGKHIAENIVKLLIRENVAVRNAKIAFLGFTFKENCPDIRNTKVIDIINELSSYSIDSLVTDPLADPAETYNEYKVQLRNLSELNSVDAVVIPVAHSLYRQMTMEQLDRLYSGKTPKILIDVKGIFSKTEYEAAQYIYWRL